MIEQITTKWTALRYHHKIAAIITINFILLLVLWHTLISPIRDDIALLADSLHNIYTKEHTLQRYAMTEQEFVALYDAKQQELTALQERLPEIMDEQLALMQIHQLAERHQVFVESSKVVPYITDNNILYSQKLLECRLQSDYFMLLKFLQELSQQKTLIDSKIITINVDERGKLQVTLHIRYFARADIKSDI